MPITALPTPPARSMSSDAFVAAADAFLGALPTFQFEANALEANVNGKETSVTASASDAATSASSASNSATNAAASAATAALYGTAALWVSGTTYAGGNVVIAPANRLLYKRRAAGAGTTDPSLDATNWESVGLTGGSTNIKLSAILATLPAITIVDHCLHLERDDTPRARGWRKRKGQSWRSETRYTGTQYGSYASATAAYSAGLRGTDTAADIYYQTGGTTGFYAMTGVNTSTIIYRAGIEDYPTNALITAEAARVIIWDLDGAAPTMWMVFNAGATNAVRGTIQVIACINDSLYVGQGAALGLNYIVFVSDTNNLIAATGIHNSANIASRNSRASWIVSASSPAIVNNTVNDVAITVLPNAPTDEYGMPVPNIAVATAGGVSEILNDGTVKNSLSTTAAYGISYDDLGRIRWNTTTEYNCSPVAPRAAAFTASSAIEPKLSNAAYSSSNVPLGLTIASATGKSVKNAIASTNGLTLYHAGQSASALFANITSTYNTGWMVGDIRAAFLCNSKTVDRSISALTLVEVGTVTETAYSGGRSIYSGFSAANYLQIASNAAFNALGTGDFSIIMSGVKWGTASSDRCLLSFGDGTASGHFGIFLTVTNVLAFYAHNGVSWASRAASTITFTDTAEHLLTITRGTFGGVASTLQILVDGVTVASAVYSTSISNGTAGLFIGVKGDVTVPFAGGQCACVRISATAPTAEQSKFIAATENMLNGGHACLLSNSSSVAQLDYCNRSDMIAVGNGTNTDFFNNLAREGVVTTSTGAIVSGTIPSEAVIFHTGTTNTVRVGERNVGAELTEQLPSIPKTQYYSFTSSGTTQALPKGWKARGVAFNLTDGTMLAVAQTFDGFIYTQTGLTNAKAYQVELEEVV